MGVSSKILWHQTNAKNAKSILMSKKLSYNYCEEQFSGEDGNMFSACFPMISLFNMPLEQLYDYIKEGGKYGNVIIGFKEEWWKRNGFSPVNYCTKEAIFFKTISFQCNELLNNPHVKDSFKFLTCAYTKMYENDLREHNYKLYRFYDEREFRLVPNLDELEECELPFVSKEKKIEGVDALAGVSFELSDISIIIVENEESIIKCRKTIGDSNVTILTYKQVIHDILGIDHNIEVNPPIRYNNQMIELDGVGNLKSNVENHLKELRHKQDLKSW